MSHTSTKRNNNNKKKETEEIQEMEKTEKRAKTSDSTTVEGIYNKFFRKVNAE